jgi:hypothetical protein
VTAISPRDDIDVNVMAALCVVAVGLSMSINGRYDLAIRLELVYALADFPFEPAAALEIAERHFDSGPYDTLRRV